MSLGTPSTCEACSKNVFQLLIKKKVGDYVQGQCSLITHELSLIKHLNNTRTVFVFTDLSLRTLKCDGFPLHRMLEGVKKINEIFLKM